MNARGIIALIVLLASACSTELNTPSASVTTMEPVWPQYFTLDWSLEPAMAGWHKIDGYIYSNSKAFPAQNMQILAQALDASGAVVGQRLEWVPGVLPPGGWVYFTVGPLPPADAYRVSVWHWEFQQMPGGRRRF